MILCYLKYFMFKHMDQSNSPSHEVYDLKFKMYFFYFYSLLMRCNMYPICN